MDDLHVSVDDLRLLSAAYQSSAEQLDCDGSIGAVGSLQPSAAAVQALHAATAAAREVLAARATAIGVAVTAADSRYVAKEAESAAQIHSLGSQAV